MTKLSVVLATKNEQENIGRCLKSVRSIANEIKEVLRMSDSEILKRKVPELFMRHQRLLEREGSLPQAKSRQAGRSGVVAFFIPRRNMFLGKPLIHAGVYPDPSIRLIKRGKARLPGKSVHEIMEVDGQVSWLVNDMLHYDSPTLERYLNRLNRYTDLHAEELKSKKVKLNFFSLLNYSFVKPTIVFFKLYFRHRGYLDGMRGFVWCLFSSLHFPIAYFKYYSNEKNRS